MERRARFHRGVRERDGDLPLKPCRTPNGVRRFGVRSARSLIASFGDRSVGRVKLDICRARRELSGAASTVSCGDLVVGGGGLDSVAKLSFCLGKTSPALLVPTCILTSPCWRSRPCGRRQPLSRCERDQRR